MQGPRAVHGRQRRVPRAPKPSRRHALLPGVSHRGHHGRVPVWRFVSSPGLPFACAFILLLNSVSLSFNFSRMRTRFDEILPGGAWRPSRGLHADCA